MIETRTNAYQVRKGEFSDELISVYFTVRQYGSLEVESSYEETFVEHWLHKVLFFEAEPWVFTMIYTGFGVLVVLVWFLGGRDAKDV